LVRATMMRRSAARAGRDGLVAASDGCPWCGTAKKLRVRRVVNAQVGIIEGILSGDLVMVERPVALGQTRVRPLGAPRVARALESALNAALALGVRVRTP